MRSTTAIQELPVDECLRLLESNPVKLGRVAFSGEDGEIVVLPVNYRIWRGAVVFHTNPGSKLAAIRDGRRMAFEVDEVDVAWREGWSVLVQGIGREIDDPDEVAAINAIGLTAWAGADSNTVEILPIAITGRRLT